MSPPRERTVPSLLIEDSSAGRRTVPLEAEVTRLGRQGANDIQLLEPHVSKRHAEILRDGERYVVVNVGSKAGVYVNGVRVERRTLADGDVITLGESTLPSLMFHWNVSAVARPPAPDLLSMRTTISPGAAGRGLESLAKFLEFGRLYSRQLNLTTILENVVDLAAEITEAERGFLITLAADGSLEYRVARDRSGSPIPPSSLSVSETIVREVLEAGATRIISDVREDVDVVDLKSVVELQLGSVVAMPLHRFAIDDSVSRPRSPGGEVFGVLYLDSRERADVFSRIDRGILETLARDASSVIENARLFRDAEEKARLQDEMDRAREVQEALLPQSFWHEPHFEVAGSCVPSRHLGGDYLDQFRLEGGRCGLVIADVSGKGVPAALLAASLHGILAAETATDQPLRAMVERINRAICRRVPLGKFVTFFCCILAPDGNLVYVNAGHPPPMVVGAGRPIEQLSTGDMALGFRDGNEYHEERLRLRAGDVVAMYTDGVTEAVDPSDQLFEEVRLEQVLTAACRLPASDILASSLETVQAFSGGAPARDDITLLVLKYLGAQAEDGAAPRGGADV